MTRHERPIPNDLLRFLLAVILAVTVVTALSNFGHGQQLATYAGQDEHQAKLAALVPDALISIGITVLAFRHRNVWAWCCLTAGVLFLGWSGVVTALPGFCATPGEGSCGAEAADAATRVGVALWPLLAAVLLAGVGASLLHARAPHGVTLNAGVDPKNALKAPPKKKTSPARPETTKSQAKPPVTSPMTPAPTAPTPTSSTVAEATPTTSTDEQAARLTTATRHAREGMRRADVIRAVMTEHGVSKSTAERAVDAARKNLMETAGATS